MNRRKFIIGLLEDLIIVLVSYAGIYVSYRMFHDFPEHHMLALVAGMSFTLLFFYKGGCVLSWIGRLSSDKRGVNNNQKR